MLDKFSLILLASCRTLALSTTLATNACVENRGGKGKLVFIGLSRETLENTYQDYGIDSLDDVYLLECNIQPNPDTSTQPDWEQFRKDLPEFCRHCDCLSVVQLFAKEHFASYEKKAASIIKETLDIPVILGHELFPDRNIIRRGAGALLNARLIPVIQDHVPKTVKDGIQIGDWKTFVKGLFIDTFALGGDTAIHYRCDGTLYLEKYRIIPLCTLASKYTDVLPQLKELETQYPMGHTYYLHEFYCLVKDIEENPNYTEFEKSFCRALKNGPLILSNAANAVGKDIYTLDVTRLEEDGIIIRSGLTPTDIMHIRHDFNTYNAEASETAAKLIAKYAGISIETLCESAYTLIEEKLYCNLVRILLQEEYFDFKKENFDENLEELIRTSYYKAKEGNDNYISALFRTKAKLVAVGAPTGIFIDHVAELLGTTAVIPKHAAVANAIGAIVGNISVTKQTEIKPAYDSEKINGYYVLGADSTEYFEDYEDALEHAASLAAAYAIDGAHAQGASENITTTTKVSRKEAVIGGSALFLKEFVSVTATGKA